MTVDYKKLLKKYAQYVYENEGTDFLDGEIGLGGCVPSDEFTDEEIEALKEAAV